MSSSDSLSGLDLSSIPYDSPPPGQVSNFINPETLTGTAVAISTVTLTLALTLLLVRLYSTIIVNRSVGSDDFTMVVAYIFSTASTAFMLSSSALARHSWDFALAMYTPRLAKLRFAQHLTIAMALFFSKISILILYHRIFSLHRIFRYANYLGMAWIASIAIASIILNAVYCTPRPRQSFDSEPVAVRCNSLERPIVIRSAFIVALDFYIFLLPLPLLLKLQLTTRRKVELAIVFMTGSIACVASVLGLSFRIELFEGTDKTWNGYRVEIAAVVETNIAIMVACMPACATFYKHISPKLSVCSSFKAWIAKSRPSTSDTSLQDTQVKMSGTKSITNDEHRGNDGNRRFWRLKKGLRSGDSPAEIVFNVEESQILSNNGVSVSEGKGSLEFYHASFDGAGQYLEHKEDV